MVHHRFLAAFALLALCAAGPIAAMARFGHAMFMPPEWLHFYGVGLSAVVATLAAVLLTTAAVRQQDVRTVVLAGGFGVMAALLAVHGLTTPGVLVGPNGVVALTGAATLPLGAAVMMLAGRPRFRSPGSIRLLLGLQLTLAACIVTLSLLAVLVPNLVPSLPKARSTPAYLVMAVGLFLYASLAIRATRTFLLTRRIGDLAVIVGLVLLGTAVYGALALSYMELGWWLGHLFELGGIFIVGAAVAFDLRRGRQSRSLIGDLTAGEIVAEEEAFLGARVRALMLRLAEKDVSTEEHTRRVAKLAVAVGEELGLSANRLRSLAIGGLLHDIGKLSVPSTILKKPAALDPDEYAAIKLHPERGSDLLAELGGFEAGVARLVLDHHERLDGGGYPRGRSSANLNLETRILSVCDVFDALVSPRVYRDAWPVERALQLLEDESGSAFDAVCVQALVRVLGREAGGELAAAA